MSAAVEEEQCPQMFDEVCFTCFLLFSGGVGAVENSLLWFKLC